MSDQHAEQAERESRALEMDRKLDHIIESGKVNIRREIAAAAMLVLLGKEDLRQLWYDRSNDAVERIADVSVRQADALMAALENTSADAC